MNEWRAIVTDSPGKKAPLTLKFFSPGEMFGGGAFSPGEGARFVVAESAHWCLTEQLIGDQFLSGRTKRRKGPIACSMLLLFFDGGGKKEILQPMESNSKPSSK